MRRQQYMAILKKLQQACKITNEVNMEENPEECVRYEVLQFSDIARDWNSVHEIAHFYNVNWTGNKDFMHIPEFYQVLENCKNYPVLIARHKDSKEILGISTVKYEENSEEVVEPYFPELGAKYFSVTGILVKKDSPHRGIGKKIYEIAIKGAYEYEKEYPGTRIMCVIDCRNSHSLKALSTAVENINDKLSEERQTELPAYILGYYTIQNDTNRDLVEAPTLILEVGLSEQKKKQSSLESDMLSYQEHEEVPLFNSLLATLKEKFQKYGVREPVIHQDEGWGNVYFYSLQDRDKCRLEKIQVVANGTEKGNDRIPNPEDQIRNFVGPLPKIYEEEDDEIGR